MLARANASFHDSERVASRLQCSVASIWTRSARRAAASAARRRPAPAGRTTPWREPLRHSLGSHGRIVRSGVAARPLLAIGAPCPPSRLADLQISADHARRFLVRRHLLAPPRALPARGRIGPARDRAPGPAAVRPAGGAGRPQPRPGAARAHPRLPARLVRGVAVRARSAPDRDLQQEPEHRCPSRSCRTTRSPGTAPAATTTGPDPARAGSRGRRDPWPRSAATARCRPPSFKEHNHAVDWWWAPTSAARAVMEALFVTGRLGIARRDGNRRYYDLIERLVPARAAATRARRRTRRCAIGCSAAIGRSACWPARRRPTSSYSTGTARGSRALDGRAGGGRHADPGRVEGVQAAALPPGRRACRPGGHRLPRAPRRPPSPSWRRWIR